VFSVPSGVCLEPCEWCRMPTLPWDKELLNFGFGGIVQLKMGGKSKHKHKFAS